MQKVTVNIKVKANELYRHMALISAHFNLGKMAEFFRGEYIDSYRFKIGKGKWRKVE